MASTFFPAETDFTLQNNDNWFYKDEGVHSAHDLRIMYETSAGSNTALIIDIAPFAQATKSKITPPAIQEVYAGQLITVIR